MAMQKDMMGRAVRDSFAKLDPRVQIQNPVSYTHLTLPTTERV